MLGTQDATLYTTFGKKQFLEAVHAMGWSKWTLISESCYMGNLSPDAIGSLAQKFKKRYKPVIICNEENGKLFISSYGDQDKFDLDKKRYDSDPDFAKSCYERGVQKRAVRFQQRAFPSPNGVNEFDALLHDMFMNDTNWSGTDLNDLNNFKLDG